MPVPAPEEPQPSESPIIIATTKTCSRFAVASRASANEFRRTTNHHCGRTAICLRRACLMLACAQHVVLYKIGYTGTRERKASRYMRVLARHLWTHAKRRYGASVECVMQRGNEFEEMRHCKQALNKTNHMRKTKHIYSKHSWPTINETLNVRINL